MTFDEKKELERRINHRLDVCIYFTGIQNTLCNAKVNIRELVGGSDLGWAIRIPCMLSDSKNCKVVCSSRKFRTREEAEKEVMEDDRVTKLHITAINATHIDAKQKGLGKGHGGVNKLKCPLCDGEINYSVSSYNGHIWGKCTTDSCISWME